MIRAGSESLMRGVWGRFAEPEILSHEAARCFFAGNREEAARLDRQSRIARWRNSTPEQRRAVLQAAAAHEGVSPAWHTSGDIQIVCWGPDETVWARRVS